MRYEWQHNVYHQVLQFCLTTTLLTIRYIPSIPDYFDYIVLALTNIIEHMLYYINTQ